VRLSHPCAEFGSTEPFLRAPKGAVRVRSRCEGCARADGVTARPWREIPTPAGPLRSPRQRMRKEAAALSTAPIVSGAEGWVAPKSCVGPTPRAPTRACEIRTPVGPFGVPKLTYVWTARGSERQRLREESQADGACCASRNIFASACRSFQPTTPFRSTRGRKSQRVMP
jgi:hypothetical protein